jgi:hypothetical protein
VCGLAPATVTAQTLSGRVLMPDSLTPASGIVVTVSTPSGSVMGRVLSSANGAYSVRLKAGGSYDLRALRIGYRPSVIRLVVSATDTTRRDIVLNSLPVEIAAMLVDGDRDCTLKGKDGQRFLSLWEQARAALAATSLSEQAGVLDVDQIRVNGHMDAVRTWSQDPNAHESVDTLTARHIALSRAFASTPPETLAAVGYVRASADGRPVFDMPNAEALLSDDFVGAHCFRLRGNSDHPDWIGLGFEPRRRVDGYVDIDGTLWIDRATAELRTVDFQYANLPKRSYPACDTAPFIPVRGDILHDDPPFEQPQPNCGTFKDDQKNVLGLGGSASFVRLSSGEWLVSRWKLITPPDSARYRAGHRFRFNSRTRQLERCWDGPKCRTMIAMRPRLVTISGVTTRVARDGVELYGDTSMASLIPAMLAHRAKAGSSTLVGFVYDESRHPIVNAIVQTEDPWVATRTDSTGRFLIAVLPAGELILSARCSGYTPVRFRTQLERNGTREVVVPLKNDPIAGGSKACGTR